jgi:hypothetical protein
LGDVDEAETQVPLPRLCTHTCTSTPAHTKLNYLNAYIHVCMHACTHTHIYVHSMQAAARRLPAPEVASGEEDALALAKAYFDVREYRRAAHLLGLMCMCVRAHARMHINMYVCIDKCRSHGAVLVLDLTTFIYACMHTYLHTYIHP